jgi:hypothetical protein
MKKVISFCLYGTAPSYQDGAIENIHAAKIIYPDWVCRFYVSTEVKVETVDLMRKLGAEVIIKKRIADSDGMFWRFLAACDETVDIVIVRDTDSRLTTREKLAVDDWLNSDKNFHIMRDHPLHNTLIPGGMWGCRNYVLSNLNSYMKGWKQFERGDDQKFLAKKIYPLVKNSLKIHTDLVAYEGEQITPFPSERIGSEFIGQYFRDEAAKELEFIKMLETASFQILTMPEYGFKKNIKRLLRKLKTEFLSTTP